MAKLLAASHSIVLPPLRVSSRCQNQTVDCASGRFLTTRSVPICCHRQRSNHLRKGIGGAIVSAVSDSRAPPLLFESAGEGIEIETNTGGGNGFDGVSGGGGGGGGGGDNNGGGDSEGEGGSEDRGEKKMAMTMSQKLTLGYAALVGVGGVMGYLKSGSQKSLMAGGLSALLLYFVYTELPRRPAFASSLGLGVSAALLGVMGSRFKKSGKIFPAGVVSFVSLVMTGGYLHGILRGLH